VGGREGGEIIALIRYNAFTMARIYRNIIHLSSRIKGGFVRELGVILEPHEVEQTGEEVVGESGGSQLRIEHLVIRRPQPPERQLPAPRERE
jgi:hypothetical protein